MVVRKVTEVLEAKGAILRILNVDTRQLELGAAYGLSDRYIAKGPVTSKKLITDLCKDNKVIIVDDILRDPRVQYPLEGWEEGIRAMVDVPLTLRQNVIGIIRICFAEERSFCREELDFVTVIGQQCACAIDKARMFEEHQLRYDHLVLQTEKLSAMGRLAAGIAHEINNPLSSILLYSSNLIKKAPGQGPFREGLGIIIQEATRCKGIIQDLLELARNKETRKSATDINSIIEKALVVLENEFFIRQITVEKDLAPDMPENFLEADQIRQLILNLLINAAEAIQEKGTIKIRTYISADAKSQIIEVSDNGCGISQDDLPKIFEPFFSGKPKGTGLGLSVSYGIVQKHQGEIEVQSKPGEGSRFIVKLKYFVG
jgi:signal transduction histidine kinase